MKKIKNALLNKTTHERKKEIGEKRGNQTEEICVNEHGKKKSEVTSTF